MTGGRVPAVVLGATGIVGQRIVRRLADHPWFELVATAASEKSAGRPYAEACRWRLPGEVPESVAGGRVAPLDPGAIRCDLPAVAFSALPTDVAGRVEPRFAEAGFAVCSNASVHRDEPDVPLIIPEVNPGHLALLERQRVERGWSGLLVTNPNCSTTGIVLALKPLDDGFGALRVSVTTLQAVSGAGYPGIPSLDILGNTIPWIPGEEGKIERETRQLLGTIDAGVRAEAELVIGAQVHRIPVIDGHTFSLAIGFRRPPAPEEAIERMEAFRGPMTVRRLPSAPECPIRVTMAPERPQPRFDVGEHDGMTVVIGRIRRCPVLDLRLVGLVHNTSRGAAGGAVLNAELLVAEGWLG